MSVSAIDVALAALQAVPGLAELVGEAIDALSLSSDDPRKPLADHVRERLPERGATRRALDDLEAKELAEQLSEDPPEP